MNLKITFDVNDTAYTFEAELENCVEQINWHLERHIKSNFNLADIDGNQVGTVEVAE